jgi:hypothetical protein
LAGLAVGAVPAAASFHLMKVREVFPSSSAATNDGYIELQMWTANQELVGGHTVSIYDASGGLIRSAPLDSLGPKAQSASQATILLGEAAAAGNPDTEDNGLNIPPAGGAACFDDAEPIDCVAWGSFAGSPPAGATVGDPASPGGITAGKALHRTISPLCPTRLEPGDDTDDSATDFSEQNPAPRNNASPIVEVACPETFIGNPRPPNPTNQTSPTFNFTSTNPAGGPFTCKLDSEPDFTACTTPKTYPGPLSEGSHTFQVRAGTDPTPATYTWVVDLTPPDTVINDPKPVDPNASASSSLTFSAPGETLPTFQCRLITPSVPNPSFAACTSPANASTPSSGDYTFEVRATDRAGNQDGSPAAYPWTVDRTPPDTTITNQPPNPSLSSAADFAFTSTEPMSTFRCRLDDAPAFTTCPVDGIYTGLFDGEHTFRVRAADALENEDPTEASYTWTVDASSDPPPETTITRAPKRRGTDRTPKIKFEADPATDAAFECRVDDKPFAACTSPHTTRKLKLGRHTFEVFATGPGGPDDTPDRARFKIVKR